VNGMSHLESPQGQGRQTVPIGKPQGNYLEW
jgi:hypothetical protein